MRARSWGRMPEFIPPTMRLRFTHDTVEDASDRLHRVGCPRLQDNVEVHRHAAGSSIQRDTAPLERSSCQPNIELSRASSAKPDARSG